MKIRLKTLWGALEKFMDIVCNMMELLLVDRLDIISCIYIYFFPFFIFMMASVGYTE